MSVNIIGDRRRIGEGVKFYGTGTVNLLNGAVIRDYSVIEMDRGELVIGPNSVIGYHNVIQCSGIMKIGSGTLIGPNCTMLASSHEITTERLVDIPLIRGSLVIGDNVWIGAAVTVNYNITIGNNAIIAGNSFCNKDIPENEIWGGVPVRFIRSKN